MASCHARQLRKSNVLAAKCLDLRALGVHPRRDCRISGDAVCLPTRGKGPGGDRGRAGPGDPTGDRMGRSPPADFRGRQGRRALPWRIHPEPGGDRGDRVFEPVLRRGRCGLYDGEPAHRRRHGYALACPLHHRRCRGPDRHGPLRRSPRYPPIRRQGIEAERRVFQHSCDLSRNDRGDRRPDRRRSRAHQQGCRPHQSGDLQPARQTERKAKRAARTASRGADQRHRRAGRPRRKGAGESFFT